MQIAPTMQGTAPAARRHDVRVVLAPQATRRIGRLKLLTAVVLRLKARVAALEEVVPGAVEVEGWWSPSGRCRSGIVRRAACNS